MLVRAISIRDVMSDTFYRFKDNDLIKLVLEDKDWECVEQLINILGPLKEATLLASQDGESLMVTKMLAVYEFCVVSLEESLSRFNSDDDIHIGIEGALEKLVHYYDQISPMIGIASILDPAKKKQFLSSCLRWKQTWVESVMENFKGSYKFYRQKSPEQAPVISAVTSLGRYGEFIKKQRGVQNAVDSNLVEEYVRYLNAPLAEFGAESKPLLFPSTGFHYIHSIIPNIFFGNIV
jgi:hypothetical protein